MAAEAVVGGVPMLAFVAHLPLVHSDGFSAGVAVFREHGVEAVEAVGAAVPHDVALTAQLALAFGAGEVLHVPGSSFGFRALVR